jgi:glucose/arabinose dehydrogenase
VRRAVVAVLAVSVSVSVCAEIVRSQVETFEIVEITDELRAPWGMAFLPNGDLLITERAGRLRLVVDGQLRSAPIAGPPGVVATGQGGLLGLALDPQFAANRLVYVAYAAGGRGRFGTEVARGRFDGREFTSVVTIFRALPKASGGRHFGSRLLFGPDGTLFVTLGERGEQASAQDLGQHRGKLIRLHADGSVPADNPFVGRADVRPEIFSFGHRNVQGMAINPATGVMWTHEHGPQGGDEVNVMRAGANYGWPVITYGVNYVIGTKIGVGTHRDGMEQPIHVWVPSIAPSGMMFYTGAAFPAWHGDLFVGSLKFGVLVRLSVDGDTITGEERLLDGGYGRVRDVVQGPDGYLYLLTDDGKLLRIAPPAVH